MGSIVSQWLFGARSAPPAEPAPPRADVDSIRRELMRTLQPCSEAHRMRGGAKVERADGALDLWLLRSEIYLYLAQDLGQVEATMRINSLVPLFRGWVPEVHEHRYHP